MFSSDDHSIGQTPPADAFTRRAELIRVIDADTIRLRIDQGWLSTLEDDIRLAGCNAPEQRGEERPAGLYVTRKVCEFIDRRAGRVIMLRSDYFVRGKFGRCLCTLWWGDDCLNDYLVQNDLAWPADEQGRVIGERSLDRLKVPGSKRFDD